MRILGAETHSNKVVVTFLSLLQLALFWIFASFALAVTTVSRRELIELTRNPNLYQGIYISVLLLIVPWIMIVGLILCLFVNFHSIVATGR